jgi:hypothetical protein
MTIKVILRDGRIQPLEPLPTHWSEGQELVVEQPGRLGTEAEIIEWDKEIEAEARWISAEESAGEHDRFQRTLEEIERESKRVVKREWR